jgi:hypothetical protein
MLTIFQQSQGPTETKLDPSELDPKLLLQTPTPRAVEMGWPIKVQIGVCALFLTAIVAWWVGDTVTPSNYFGYMERFVPGLVFLLLVAVVCSEVIQELRNRRLLRYGNCVQGRVVDRIKAGAGKRRRTLIVYQFAVGPGKPMTATGNDYTHSCSKNSSVLVFFDPEPLERNVAICSTGWRVRDAEGRTLEP